MGIKTAVARSAGLVNCRAPIPGAGIPGLYVVARSARFLILSQRWVSQVCDYP